MNDAVLVALISFAGTLVGSAGGILAAGKLTAFRLAQLEEKLDTQSHSVAKIPVLEEKIQNLNRRIAVFDREVPYFYEAN